MKYLIIFAFVSISVAYFLFYLKNKESFENNTSICDDCSRFTPSPFSPMDTNVESSYTQTTENENAVNESNSDNIIVRPNIYDSYINTDFKNNYGCDDGMVFDEHLGVCLSVNDNAYLNEFNVIGVMPPCSE